MQALIAIANAGLLVLAIFLTVLASYMLVTVIGSWCAWLRRSAIDSAQPIKTAIVIPAHNEGEGIVETLEDIRALDYPDELYDVYVIADNCSDDTAKIAAAHGAVVAERFDSELRGKGQALDWFLKTYRDALEDTEAVVFIDADMRVEPQFLKAAASSFANTDRQVLQSRYTITPDVPSWSSAAAFASFAYVNHVRPSGRGFFGGTCRLNGSGMVFRTALILETGWPMHSIAEDVEFGNELMMRGIRVHYEPLAVVTSQVPATLKQVSVQQERWEGGKLYVLRKYIAPVLSRLLTQPKYLWLDMLLDLMIPPLSIVVAASLGGALLSFVVGSNLLWLFLVPLCVFATAIITGLIQLRAPAKVWKLFYMAPVFIGWKLLLMASVVFKPAQTQWKRTPRGADESS